MFPPVKKLKDKFILSLNKNLYKIECIDKAADQDKNWVRVLAPKGSYISVELETNDFKEVLEWANYLLYLNKTA